MQPVVLDTDVASRLQRRTLPDVFEAVLLRKTTLLTFVSVAEMPSGPETVRPPRYDVSHGNQAYPKEFRMEVVTTAVRKSDDGAKPEEKLSDRERMLKLAEHSVVFDAKKLQRRDLFSSDEEFDAFLADIYRYRRNS